MDSSQGALYHFPQALKLERTNESPQLEQLGALG